MQKIQHKNYATTGTQQKINGAKTGLTTLKHKTVSITLFATPNTFQISLLTAFQI